jgi:superfamily II DNA or RNA helicase
MVAMNRPDPDFFWRSYAALGPAERLIMELKALLGAPTSKTIFLDALRACGTPCPGGKSWSATSLNPILDELARQGLLDQALACAPALTHRLARHAAESPAGARLLEGLDRALPRSMREQKHFYFSSSLASDTDLFRRFRLSIYANVAGEFARLVKIVRAEDGEDGGAILARFLGDLPADAAWLEGRKPPIQAALAASSLVGLLDRGLVRDDLSAAIAILTCEAAPSWDVSRLLIRRALLAGAFDEAVARAEAQGPDESHILAAVRAAIAFLSGDNAIALAGFREALKLAKRRLAKRKIVLDGEFGLLHVLALLRAHDASLRAEIRALLDIGLAAGPPWTAAYVALEALLHLVSGQESSARIAAAKVAELAPDPPFATALVGLAEVTLDSEAARRHEAKNKAALQTVASLLPVVGLVHAQALSRAGLRNDRRRDSGLVVTDLKVIDFTEIVAVKPVWERAFETLHVLLAADGQSKATDARGQSVRRLAFFVDSHSKSIEPLEQSVQKREWSAGRTIALKRLHEQDAKLDYLTEHDRRVLRCLRRHNDWYNGTTYAFDADKALVALIGHPLVFDARARTRRVELIAYPAELVVKETKAGYLLDLSHRCEHPAVFVEAETPVRWRVIEVDEKLITLQETLGTGGLVVPRAAKEQVVALLRAKTPLVPIRSELADVDVETFEGVTTPIVQLTRSGDGLKLSLVVRPLGAEGPFYIAGQGGRSVLVTVDGLRQRITRDLDAETRAARAFVEACPSLAPWRVGDHAWEIGELTAALEFLVEARAFAGGVHFEWPEGEELKISRPVAPSSVSFKLTRARDWFEIAGKLEIDEDLVLDMEEVLGRLDKAKGRFVPLDDGRFVALTEDLQRQVGQLHALSEETQNGRRMHRLGALALAEIVADAGALGADKHWRAHVEKIRSARAHVPRVPSTLQAELRDYQVEGFVWLSRLAHLGMGAYLADDMGLGKTVQTIAVLLEHQAKGPSLIVAPTSVCHNWESEIARFAPVLAVHVLGLAEDRAALVEQLGPGDILLASYGLLHQEEEALTARSWTIVVFDEAQNLKNATTKRAKASRAITADFRVALSGTPIENDLEELWSLFNTITPGLLGSREGFQKRFAAPIERDRKLPARDALRCLIRPFILRRTKSAVLRELPSRTEVNIEIDLSSEERAFYEAMRRKAITTLAALDGPAGQRKIHILAEIMRLRRACCHPTLVDPSSGLDSAKLSTFLELVEELIRNRHKALVFSQFVGHLEKVRAALDARGVSYQYLDGSVPSGKRAERVETFQRGSGDLFLISLKAGGAGLNLTAADYVIHLDPWWNPAVEDQASDRAHRIGQTRPVTIYRLIARDTIEEKILDLHARKRDLAADFLDGAEIAARLGEDELLALIGG